MCSLLVVFVSAHGKQQPFFISLGPMFLLMTGFGVLLSLHVVTHLMFLYFMVLIPQCGRHQNKCSLPLSLYLNFLLWFNHSSLLYLFTSSESMVEALLHEMVSSFGLSGLLVCDMPGSRTMVVCDPKEKRQTCSLLFMFDHVVGLHQCSRTVMFSSSN